MYVTDDDTSPLALCAVLRGVYDPRLLIKGEESDDGSWRGGLFDRGSFTELLSGWAMTVVTGRARLGGQPVGILAVETRAVEGPCMCAHVHRGIMVEVRSITPNSLLFRLY